MKENKLKQIIITSSISTLAIPLIAVSCNKKLTPKEEHDMLFQKYKKRYIDGSQYEFDDFEDFQFDLHGDIRGSVKSLKNVKTNVVYTVYTFTANFYARYFDWYFDFFKKYNVYKEVIDKFDPSRSKQYENVNVSFPHESKVYYVKESHFNFTFNEAPSTANTFFSLDFNRETKGIESYKQLQNIDWKFNFWYSLFTIPNANIKANLWYWSDMIDSDDRHFYFNYVRNNEFLNYPLSYHSNLMINVLDRHHYISNYITSNKEMFFIANSIPKPKSQYASFKYKNEQPQVFRNILTERDDFLDYYRSFTWFPSLDEMKNKFGNNSSKNFWSYYIKWVPFPKKDDGSSRQPEIIENFTND